MATGGGEQSQYSDSLGSDDLDDLKCQPCHEVGDIRNAVGICLDCQDYLCQMCFEGHTLPKPCRHHQLLDKTEMLKTKVQLYRKDKCNQMCPQHDDEVVKYYCTEHNQLGCGVCLSLNHRICKVQYIPDAAKDLGNNEEFKQIEKWLHSVQKRSESVTDATAINAKSIDSSCKEALKKMEKHRSDVNVALDSIRDDLIKKTNAAKLKAKENLTHITEKHEVIRRELQTVQTRIAMLEASNQNCNLYIEMMIIKDRIEPLEAAVKEAQREMSNQTKEIVFTPNHEHLDMLKTPEIFGTLSYTGKIDIVKAEHVKDINVASSTDSKTSSITGSVLLSDSRLVIADFGNKCLKSVDVEQNQVTAQVKVPSTPFDLCKISDKEVAVTLFEEKKIAFVKVDGAMRIDRTINVDGECMGLDIKEDTLAVSFRSPGKVQILTLQGQLLHNIATDTAGKALFVKPLYVTLDKDITHTRIYVSDITCNCLLYLKLDGTILASYTDMCLNSPRKTVFDGTGKLYVCASGSHIIRQIYPDCKKSRVMLTKTDGLCTPQTISFCGVQTKFYVGMQNNNKIKVYRGLAG